MNMEQLNIAVKRAHGQDECSAKSVRPDAPEMYVPSVVYQERRRRGSPFVVRTRQVRQNEMKNLGNNVLSVVGNWWGHAKTRKPFLTIWNPIIT